MGSFRNTLIKLALIVLLSSVTCHDKEWLEVAKKEVKRLMNPYPEEADKLLYYIKTSFEFTTDMLPSDVLIDESTKLEYPEEVLNKILAILFTDSIEYQAFTFNKVDDVGKLNESLGIVRKLNGWVSIFYLEAEAFASLRTQNDTTLIKECITFIDWEHCEFFEHYVPRPFTLAEISLINDALRSKVYEGLFMEIEKQENLMFLSEKDNSETSYFDMFNEEEKHNTEKIDTVLQIYKNDKYIRQLPSNAADINKFMSRNEFPSIAPIYLEQYFKNLFNNISGKILDDNYTILYLILNSLESHNENNISSVKLFVTNNQSKLIMYYLILQYDATDKKYSIRVKSMETDIKLETSLLFIKINDYDLLNISKREGFEADNLTNELKPLMNLFELVCQLKF